MKLLLSESVRSSIMLGINLASAHSWFSCIVVWNFQGAPWWPSTASGWDKWCTGGSQCSNNGFHLPNQPSGYSLVHFLLACSWEAKSNSDCNIFFFLSNEVSIWWFGKCSYYPHIIAVHTTCTTYNILINHLLPFLVAPPVNTLTHFHSRPNPHSPKQRTKSCGVFGQQYDICLFKERLFLGRMNLFGATFIKFMTNLLWVTIIHICPMRSIYTQGWQDWLITKHTYLWLQMWCAIVNLLCNEINVLRITCEEDNPETASGGSLKALSDLSIDTSDHAASSNSDEISVLSRYYLKFQPLSCHILLKGIVSCLLIWLVDPVQFIALPVPSFF